MTRATFAVSTGRTRVASVDANPARNHASPARRTETILAVRYFKDNAVRYLYTYRLRLLKWTW